jgi:hypothetical protein
VVLWVGVTVSRGCNVGEERCECGCMCEGSRVPGEEGVRRDGCDGWGKCKLALCEFALVVVGSGVVDWGAAAGCGSAMHPGTRDLPMLADAFSSTTARPLR